MPKHIVTDEGMWAGDETSLLMHLQRMALIDQRMQAGLMPTSQTGAEADPPPYLLDVQGSTAIISIKGPMSNATSVWDSYDKAATYPAIRDALVWAAQDDSIDNIVLDISTGGGAVSGVADVANLVRNINDNVKSVTAYTDGSMLSAGYWVGSGAGQVYASNIAGVGSIGVIATHVDMSKMMEQNGLTPTVMRAGKYKALANPMEPLTDAAKQQIQDGLDATYNVFVQHVANMRGVDFQEADNTMAQGRVFYGNAAQKAGLVDGITTFDGMMSKLPVDASQSVSHNPSNAFQGTTMKKALTEQQIAALAATGIVPAAADATTKAAPDAAASKEEATEKKAEATPGAASAEGAKEAPALAATTEAAATTATTATTASEASVTAFLQSQLKERDAAVLAANVELASLKQKLTEYEATMTPLIAIAAKSANNMRIALGGSAIDAKGMSAVQVLADHDAMSAQFTEKFVAGGIAAVDASQAKTSGGGIEPDGLTRARLAAAATQTSRK